MSTKYSFLRTDEELRQLADEMRSYAEENPLDPHMVKMLEINEPGEREKNGPFLRIHGKEAGILSRKYSRFIFLSTKDPRPIQIGYTVYTSNVNKSLLRQLTISNNEKKELTDSEVSRISYFFMDADLPVINVQTPRHVALMIQEYNNA